MLSPPPNPRRTRQLLRQNILASKSHSSVLDPLSDEGLYTQEEEEQSPEVYPRAAAAPRLRGHRVTARTYSPERFQEFEEERIADDWIKHGESLPDYMDPDMGFEEDPLEERVRQTPARTRAVGRPTRILSEEEEDDLLLEAELNEKRRKASRRKFLLGAVAVGGTAVAAYELLPHVPQAIGDGAANLEKQLEDAFNKGVAAGAEDAKKKLLDALATLEGFSLEGAVDAAKLTRVAYDVFINPLITLAANVTGEFLSVTLEALITGRQWLAQINEDTPTLAALQKVLQTWVDQANEMPKKVQTITETDLDGAQAYLHSLQRRIKEEQNKLNNQVTPAPAGQSTPKASPTPKP